MEMGRVLQQKRGGETSAAATASASSSSSSAVVAGSGGVSSEVEVASTSCYGITGGGGGQSQSLFPLPRPRTPPSRPDIHGVYKKQAEFNHLDKEIVLLEDVLESLEGHPPASACCKEVEEFIITRSDPLLPRNGETRRLRCRSATLCCWCSCAALRYPSCFSCNIWRKWKCSCTKVKFSCSSSCKMPSITCKCSFFKLSCIKFLNCCHCCPKKQ